MSEPETKEARLVIMKSVNGRDGWEPVKPEDVPAWVKDPEVMAHLVGGEMVMDPTIGPKGSQWFVALPAPEPVTIQ